MKNKLIIDGLTARMYLSGKVAAGGFVTIDAEDVARLHSLNVTWSAAESGRQTSRAVYAQSSFGLLHRFLMNAKDREIVDHINHDTSDNRKINLRIASKSENTLNMRGSRYGSLSGIRGVSWHMASGTWDASVTVKGQRHRLGMFDDKEVAGQAVQTFLKQNFLIPSGEVHL